MKMKCVKVISFHTVSQDYMCKHLQIINKSYNKYRKINI